MSASFFDSNIIIYDVSLDLTKATRARELLEVGGTISVQVLNEIANVTQKKMKLSWAETYLFLQVVRSLLNVRPITVEIHDKGLELAERYRLSIYDGMVAASALEAGCGVLWSEDMHHGLVIDGRLMVTNPFRTP